MGYLSPFCKLELQNVLVHLDLFKNTFSILTFAINVYVGIITALLHVSQCDHMAKLSFQYWAINNNEI